MTNAAHVIVQLTLKNNTLIVPPPGVLQPIASQGLLIHEVSGSHTTTHHSR